MQSMDRLARIADREELRLDGLAIGRGRHAVVQTRGQIGASKLPP
jgi:hypothetical protein